MRVLRWVNFVCGFLFAFGAVACLLFLPENTRDYSREPEDVWLLVFWSGTFVVLSVLCFVNAWALGRLTRR